MFKELIAIGIENDPRGKDFVNTSLTTIKKDYAKLSLFDRSDIWVVLVKTRLNTSKLIEQISNLV